jgi:hypothetical protein
VRDGKGGKDRSTVLPQRLQSPLQRHLQGVKVQFKKDRANDVDGVYLPNASTEKYPSVPIEWRRQYAFPPL